MKPIFHPALCNLLLAHDAIEHAPLASLCTLKVGGPARYLVHARNSEDVIAISRACAEHGVGMHILSGGSNTLFSDLGFGGVVMKLGSSFDFMTVENSGLNIKVGAASPFAKVTKLALSLGFGAAVGWSGTPGLIGGALRMNAGTRMGEIKDALVRIYGIKDGRACVFERSDIEFCYRQNSLAADVIITAADLGYDQALLEESSVLEGKVHEYRIKRKATQPNIASAGSFFKNPYPAFAAQLIENCNIKGLQYGGAQISSLHANFIVNNGGATANDILYIASVAQNAVFDRFGVVLSPEIRIVGDIDGPSPLCTSRFISKASANYLGPLLG